VSTTIGQSVAARLVESLVAAQQDVLRPLVVSVPDVPEPELKRLTTTLEEVVGTLYTDVIYPQLVIYPELDQEGSERPDDPPARPSEPVRASKRQVGLDLSRACRRVAVRLDEVTRLLGETEGDEARRWFNRTTVDVRRHLKDLTDLASSWAGA
jgi:hypothetical protein